MSSSGHAAYYHGSHRWFEGHRTIGGPEAWLIWVLATTFVVWLFAIQTGYAVVSPDIQKTAHLTIAQVGLAAVEDLGLTEPIALPRPDAIAAARDASNRGGAK